MKPLMSTLSVAIAFTLGVSAAQAEQVCMNADEMQSALIDWYGETPVSEVSTDMQQLWASEETGTWTMIQTRADGNACVIAQGDDWMAGSEGNQMLALLAD